MPIDLTNLVPIYQENIDAIINAMGKNVLLCFEDTVTNVAAAFNDVVRDQELRKPSFKQTNEISAPTVVTNTTIIKALIKHNPDDFRKFNINIKEGVDIVRLKTFLSDVPELLRCKYIIPDQDAVGYLEYRYRLLRNPTPVGLQTNRYALSFWERV